MFEDSEIYNCQVIDVSELIYTGELVYFVPFMYIEDTPGGRVNDTVYLVTGGEVVVSVTPLLRREC